ncbi:zinc phosphodiesterase ELAC protein 2 [Salarias fasciatus]|uniref:Zinc phosphodiesterase ELAC protein 2 n=1 Tax=Salarias fasciatus TaxID=181472 RepID=A0A672HYQ6_SALFA|nr:zinc phosphodiesterase ELAC protein 2 [Salarias fasciatus]
MNLVPVRLRLWTSLLVKGGSLSGLSPRGPDPLTPPRGGPGLPRTVSLLFRTMATQTGGRVPEQQPVPRKTRQREPLRRVKTKESRGKRRDQHGPSTVFLQVVGAGTRDSPAAVYVFSEFNRYLFNCGEGTQRLMQEHKLKAARLDNIFLTRLSWQNVGGLSGMILTLKDTGVPECVLSGPPQLESYVHAIKSFSGPLEDIRLSVRPYTEGTYVDDTMTVDQVPLFADKSSPQRSPTHRDQDHDRDQDQDQDQDPGERRPTRDPSLVVAFICKLHPRKGNFLVPEAKQLGLPVGTAAIGPMIAALKAGSSIVFQGKEIRPEQVCTPADPGPVFLVLECPSEDFVAALWSSEQLRRYQAAGPEDPAVLVVHMTPESVLRSDRYQRWMERFPSGTEHLILNEHACTVHNVRSHKIQAQLNMIHPHIFPRLHTCRAQEPQAALHVPNVRAECLLKFQLRPVLEWQRDAIPSCSSEDFVKEASEVPNFLSEVEQCRKLLSSAAAEPSGRRYPEVVFLGTGSALPMKIRNVSGTLVNISSTQALLLDCGEGTFGQLCRHYGDQVDGVLSRISTVFISHLHADHHTGLLMLLYQRERALRAVGKPVGPVLLLAPVQIMSWLTQYHDHCQEILGHVSLIPNRFLCENAETPRPRTRSLIQTLLKQNDLQQFQTCAVRHCRNAFGCSFRHRAGWKLAFSGDTMPCEALGRIGRDATLLIHEATLEDGLEDEALDKRHSTTSQAIAVGVKMNADFILLNHFSQRYAKIPLFSQDLDQRVGVSFDHMRVGLDELKLLPRLLPALKALFAEDIEEMEDRRDRRELKGLRGSGGDGGDGEDGEDGADPGRPAKRERVELEAQRCQTKRLKSS